MGTIPNGICHCGCGQPTKRYDHSDSARPWQIKGEFTRYLKHHFGFPTETTVEGDKGCWRTNRCLTRAGYAVERNRTTGTTDYIHTKNWVKKHGPVPEGKELDHLCRNRWCVNPDHLEAVEHVENVRRGAGARLTLEVVKAIIAERKGGGMAADIAKKYGVKASTVVNLYLGQSWKNVNREAIAPILADREALQQELETLIKKRDAGMADRFEKLRIYQLNTFSVLAS